MNAYENKAKKSELLEVKKKTIDELRMHFVFNALNNTRFMIKNEPDNAYEAVYNIAKFLRGSIDSIVMETDQLLEEELIFARAYLALEKLQKPRLSYEINVDDDEGYVKAGSIYRAVERMLKKYVYASKEDKILTLSREFNSIIVAIKNIDDQESIEIYEDYSCG